TEAGLLTGKAAATPDRGYKENAVVRGGMHRQGNGRSAPNGPPPPPASEKPTNLSGGFLATGKGLPGLTGEGTNSNQSAPAVPAVEVMYDKCGRLIPAQLAPLFKFGRLFVANLRSTYAEVLESVKTAGEEAWGMGFGVLTSNIEAKHKENAQD